MSKRSNRGKFTPPASPRRQGETRGAGRGLPVVIPKVVMPTSEISTNLQHLAESIEALPSDLDGKITARTVAPQDATVEVIDHGLLIRSGRPTAAQVLAIDAQPDPNNPGGVVLRLDGWNGSLLVNLSRDRADLLASRLGTAITKVRDWYKVASVLPVVGSAQQTEDAS